MTVRPRLDGELLAGPLLEADLLAYPGGVAGAVDRRGEADQAPVALESVDVAVGDLQGCAEASRRRLQDFVQLQAGGELEAGLEEQPVALFGAAGPDLRAGVTRLPPTRSLQVVKREAALVRSGIAGRRACPSRPSAARCWR